MSAIGKGFSARNGYDIFFVKAKGNFTSWFFLPQTSE